MKRIKRDTDKLMRLWKKICRSLRGCGSKKEQAATIGQFEDLVLGCRLVYSLDQLYKYGWEPNGNSLKPVGRGKTEE